MHSIQKMPPQPPISSIVTRTKPVSRKNFNRIIEDKAGKLADVEVIKENLHIRRGAPGVLSVKDLWEDRYFEFHVNVLGKSLVSNLTFHFL